MRFYPLLLSLEETLLDIAPLKSPDIAIFRKDLVWHCCSKNRSCRLHGQVVLDLQDKPFIGKKTLPNVIVLRRGEILTDFSCFSQYYYPKKRLLPDIANRSRYVAWYCYSKEKITRPIFRYNKEYCLILPFYWRGDITWYCRHWNSWLTDSYKKVYFLTLDPLRPRGPRGPSSPISPWQNINKYYWVIAVKAYKRGLADEPTASEHPKIPKI